MDYCVVFYIAIEGFNLLMKKVVLNVQKVTCCFTNVLQVCPAVIICGHVMLRQFRESVLHAKELRQESSVYITYSVLISSCFALHPYGKQ